VEAKSQILVINRVRVLGSGPHTPTQFSGSTLPGIQTNIPLDPCMSNTTLVKLKIKSVKSSTQLPEEKVMSPPG